MTQHQRHKQGSAAEHETRHEQKGHTHQPPGGDKQIVRVTYHARSRPVSGVHPPVFFAFCHPDMVVKYRQDPSSVPLSRVVDAYQVWQIPNRGVEGWAKTPSNEVLRETFGTTDIDVILDRVVREGQVQGGHHEHHESRDRSFPDLDNQVGAVYSGHR